jgi:hypothetical protein
MRDERTTAQKLAATLNWLVANDKVPGLLPRDVTAAAELLVEQETELTELRAAMAAKEHTVNATVKDVRPYRKRVAATFTITDARLYRGEVEIDAFRELQREPEDYLLHLARMLTANATANWIRELQERAYVAIRAASADTRPKGGDSTEIEAPFTSGAVPLDRRGGGGGAEAMPAHLRKERQAGRLPYILIGRAIRYTLADLETFVESSRQDKPHVSLQAERVALLPLRLRVERSSLSRLDGLPRQARGASL